MEELDVPQSTDVPRCTTLCTLRVSVILVPHCLFQLLPPSLKFTPFSVIAFNAFCHSCLLYSGHFHALTAAEVSPPPNYCHHPSRFHVPEGNASNIPALGFVTSDFISVHLSSTENWTLMVSPLTLSTPQSVLSMKSQTLIITGSPLLPRPQCLTSCLPCGGLSYLDRATVSTSLHFVLILFLVLPILRSQGWQGN